jgi:hypothetical protein
VQVGTGFPIGRKDRSMRMLLRLLMKLFFRVNREADRRQRRGRL